MNTQSVHLVINGYEKCQSSQVIFTSSIRKCYPFVCVCVRERENSHNTRIFLVERHFLIKLRSRLDDRLAKIQLWRHRGKPRLWCWNLGHMYFVRVSALSPLVGSIIRFQFVCPTTNPTARIFSCSLRSSKSAHLTWNSNLRY